MEEPESPFAVDVRNAQEIACKFLRKGNQMADARTFEEAYSTAVTSTDLRVNLGRLGDADVLIAAGWSPARVGGALLRLRSEWDRSARPRALSDTDAILLSGQLRSLPGVRAALAEQLARWGEADPRAATAQACAVLACWLSPACPACGGTKYQVAPGTHRHTAKACALCRGAGVRPVPHGQSGRRLANWMDGCLQSARSGIGRRLRNAMGPR